MKHEDVINELEPFLKIVEDVYGFYLDTTSAFYSWNKFIRETQIKASQKMNISIDELDKIPFTYGKGDPNKDASNRQHTCLQGELKERTAENGADYRQAANMCLVLIYQHWDFRRKKIAHHFGIDENEIKSDIMGDIRYLRNSILKHEGVSNHEMTRCKILKWFKEGEEIKITPEQFEEIIKIIRTSLLKTS